MSSSLIAFVSRVLKVLNLTPSKRTRPSCVPAQIYPSVVCAIACTEISGSPLSSCQELTTYWLMGCRGSSAETHCTQTSKSVHPNAPRSDFL